MMSSKARLLLPLVAAPLALAQSYASTTTFTFPGAALPTGLVASDWVIDDPPYYHEYRPENVVVSGGFLNLIVNGGQQDDEVIWSAEVSTDFSVASARVETYAILAKEPGVCNGMSFSQSISHLPALTRHLGMFYYASESQEVDIEWLSDPASQSNIDYGVGPSLWYTNQAVIAGGDATHEVGDAPSNAFSTAHNYRIDWDRKSSTFYVDGKLQYQLETNVPTLTNGSWIWNNWSNKDKGWTAGPPQADAVFKIQKIVMYYNPGS